MFHLWYGFMSLALESNQVIGLRLSKISKGGSSSMEEVELMFAEKRFACFEACVAIAVGLDAGGLVDLYRSKVAANQARLGVSH